jgi:hypothetical protein
MLCCYGYYLLKELYALFSKDINGIRILLLTYLLLLLLRLTERCNPWMYEKINSKIVYFITFAEYNFAANKV